jgi:hypothetical protein
MAHANARQWQRFAYHAAVQLRRAIADSEQPSPSAQCLDVSCGGLQVRSAFALEVGAAVSCELAWPDGLTTLPGRVRWCTPGPERDARLGIEFEMLSGTQHRSLQSLLASIDKGAQTVQLSLAALREPLAALAIPTERGIRLRAPLRLFEVGAELDFELVDPPQQFAGRVISTRLDAAEGSDAWQVEVLVEERAAPRTRRYTMYQTALGARSSQSPAATRRTTLHGSVQPAALAEAAAAAPLETATPPSAADASAPSPASAGPPAAARATHLAAARRLQPSAAERSMPARISRRPSGSHAEDDALPAIPKAWGPRLTSGLIGLLLLAGLASELTQLHSPFASRSNRARVPVPKAAATQLETAVQPASRPASSVAVADPPVAPPAAALRDTDEQAPRAPAASAGALRVGTPPISDVGGDPTLTVSGDTSEVFVPTRGSLAGMRAAIWVEPFALVIDLPDANPALAHSRYALKAGGIKLLTVGEAHGVTQLRLFLDELLARYSTEATSGGLLIRLKHDLRPLP